MAERKPIASVSLDADNLWSYLKIHGDPDWQARPGYLEVLGPRLLELFASHDLRASVFVVGSDAERGPGQQFVAGLVDAGHEVGNHSYEHEPWLHRYSRAQLDDELARVEEVLMAAGAPRPVGFRAPGYSMSSDLVDLLAERGYEYDASTLPTWIGPLARRYYFRSAKLTEEQREERSALFGSARHGLSPVRPYRWSTSNGRGLVELPVTTMPVVKVPIHASYVLYLHAIHPRLARAYIATSVRACLVTRTSPSLLLHPLDLLDGNDAPGLKFFPGMDVAAAEKRRVVDQVLQSLSRHWALGSTRDHARAVGRNTLRVRPASAIGADT